MKRAMMIAVAILSVAWVRACVRKPIEIRLPPSQRIKIEPKSSVNIGLGITIYNPSTNSAEVRITAL